LTNKKAWYVSLALILLLVIPFWAIVQNNDRDRVQPFNTDQKNSQVRSNFSPKALDQIVAKDLALTTRLFIAQLSEQIDRWATYDLSQEEIKNQFSKELREHAHFHSFAYVDGDHIDVKKGNISAEEMEKIKKLDQQEKNVFFSDPYSKNEKQFMMIAKKNGQDKWVVGEIDLSFVKRFVGTLASVADANGNYFISQKGTKVKIKEEQSGSSEYAVAKVPEVNWKIVVQSPPQEDNENKTHFKKGEAVVKVKEGENIQSLLRNNPLVRIKKESPPYFLVEHPELDTEQFIASLRQLEGLESVEPNYIYTKQETGQSVIPNDEFFEPYQWNLLQINAAEGWQITGGSEEVIIAVLDTGVDLKHTDLAAKMVKGFNAFEQNKPPVDLHGHGTHVAGISSAITNNLRGIAGVSWNNAIMPVKVLNDDGEGSLFEITAGIKWATDHGAKVINMSLGDTENSPILYDAIRYAYERDVVLIAAAGNENVSQLMYPAGYKEVLAVSAVNPDKTKAIFSNYGQHIDVAAPGESIPSLFPDNHYVYMSGTSMAAPHVSGLAGLIRSLRPELNNKEVMDLIRYTADDLGEVGHDPYFGYGLMNVNKALEYVRENKEVTFANDKVQKIENRWYITNWLRELFK